MASTDKQPRKAGRPIGSLETPQLLLTRELKFTVKAIGSIRIMVENQLEKIHKTIEATPDLSIVNQLDLLNRLTEISTALTKNIEVLAKYLMDKRVRNVADEADTPTAKPVSQNIRNMLK